MGLFQICSSQPENELITVGVAFPGRRELFQIYTNDFVIDLKSKVFEKIGIPIESQEMAFNDQILKDKKRIRFYKIQNERTIQIKGNFPQFVNVTPSDPILQKLNDRIKNGSATGNMASLPKAVPSVVGENGKGSITNTTNTTNTTITNTDSNDHDLLDVTVTFSLKFENKIVDGIVLSKKAKVKVLEQLLMTKFYLSSLKSHILVLSTAPKTERTSLLSNPELTLFEIGIQEETLYEVRALNTVFKVTLPDESVITLDFDKLDDVSKLYETLWSRGLGDEENLVLLKEGNPVPNKGTFEELGIISGSFVDLKRKADQNKILKITVKWKNKAGEQIEMVFEVPPHEQMWDFMRKIEKQGGGNSQRMSLFDEEGNEFDDEGTVSDCKFQDGTVLTVKIR